MSILSLPNEVLCAICEISGEDRRSHERDLYSIARTCRRLFHIALPSLYRSNFLSKYGSALEWAIEGNRTAVIQRALDSGLDAVRLEHLRLAIVHGPDGLFTRLWQYKAEHGGVENPNTYLPHDGFRRSTLFTTARNYGRYDAFKTLLETRRMFAKDRDQALWDAAHDGSHELVKLLLEHGANAMALHWHNMSPLSVAARCIKRCDSAKNVTSNHDGFMETTRHLLNHGVDIEHRDDERYTALDYAATAGHCQIVELLASYGADLNAKHPRLGYTALHISIWLGVGRLDMTELLLRLGADASATDDLGRSPLFFLNSSCKETIPIAKVLLESGASMEAKGDTLLRHAVAYGMPELAKFLIEEHGVDVNAVDHKGETLFCTAVGWRASIELIKFLIERGADTTMRGEGASYAMLRMVQEGTADFIRVVLENVANLKEVMGWKSLRDLVYKDRWKKSMLHAALDRKSQEIVDLMIQFGGHEGYLANNEGGRLHQGAITGDIALMQSVLDTGASLDADRDVRGDTALVVAINLGVTASINWLLEKGASPNTEGIWFSKLTPLHHATGRDAIEAVRVLLKHGAKVGSKTGAGETALHMASRSGNTEIVKMLLESGAHIWDPDDRGMTPMQLASQFHPKTVLPLLTEKPLKAGKSRRSRRRNRKRTSR
ncbi:unnamed protein product [Clonostachys byssicola]|uniref:F-box domain-containing protein n=1 Tax=Clonostachys byssicola TaxID=160290 RepID=A0A9N9UD14_9HYPO|nr:unnamed protein product [Clonostachys byssicola]